MQQSPNSSLMQLSVMSQSRTALEANESYANRSPLPGTFLFFEEKRFKEIGSNNGLLKQSEKKDFDAKKVSLSNIH